MSSIITRLYDTREKADAAATDLKRTGFLDESVSVIAPAADTAAASETGANDQVLTALRQAGLSEAGAPAFAERVRQGGTAVVVHALVGRAVPAIAILDAHGPMKLDVSGYEYAALYRPEMASATPLSTAMDWRVLYDDPTPLSSWLKWPVLSRRQNPSVKLLHEPAPLSRRTGWKLLIGDPTLLSSRFHWQVLWNNPTPLSSRTGWRVLAAKQNPSVKLLRESAPLSRALGMKVLSENPAPLSSWFGWRTLLREPDRHTHTDAVSHP